MTSGSASAPGTDGAPRDEPELRDGWGPIEDDSEVLRTRLRAALHERLRLVDWIRGLQAELEQVRSQYATGDTVELASRLEELEARHIAFVEAARIEAAEAEQRMQRAVDESIAEVKASRTWRVGTAVLAPVRWVRRGR